LDEDQRPGSSDLRVAQQTGSYIYADHSRFQSLSVRTAFVAKKSIHGTRYLLGLALFYTVANSGARFASGTALADCD
jgi:hypothetical protein